ncbi:unnamed protein product [Camellia sinensis]
MHLKWKLSLLDWELEILVLGIMGRGRPLDRRTRDLRLKKRSNAYQAAYVKADEASKALRLEQTITVKTEEDDNPVFGDDDEDLRKSLERARKFALKKQDEASTSGPQAIAFLASSTVSNSTADDQNPASGETQENKVVFTEMEEFVWGLQLDEEAHKPGREFCRVCVSEREAAFEHCLHTMQSSNVIKQRLVEREREGMCRGPAGGQGEAAARR